MNKLIETIESIESIEPIYFEYKDLPYDEITKNRQSLREKADKVKDLRCNTLICVIEDPINNLNIGAIIRNINALGVSKLYIVDSKNRMKNEDWHSMRENRGMKDASASAIKWTFVKVFKSSEECFDHLEKNNFISFGTSPHIKGKNNVSLDKGKFTHKKLAVWFGTELSGMSEYSINRCESLIQIPMAGIIESLNLSVSTGIVLYEITKQRRNFRNFIENNNK